MSEIEKIYSEIQPKFYAFFYIKTSNQATAEDLTHDVFYEAMKSIHSFLGDSTIQTWLFSIAKNLLKKHYRSKKYKRNLEEHLSMDDRKQPMSPEELFMIKQENVTLIKRINELDVLQKEIVTLRIYGELSFKEIGELIGKSENYARVTFHRIKLRLQTEMRVNDE
jgi:RNA polymerase sigma factor (sigma-70 family)